MTMNKLLLIMLALFIAAGSLNAASSSKRKKKKKSSVQYNTEQKSSSSTSSKKKKQNEKKTDDYSGMTNTQKFDPKKPTLTKQSVEDLQEKELKKLFIEDKFPVSYKHLEKENFSTTPYRSALSNLNTLIQNPELPEVTRVKVEWYKEYHKRLKEMIPAVVYIKNAIDNHDETSYKSVVDAIEKYRVTVKEFLKLPQPKVTAAEMKMIVKKNIKWRQQQYIKRSKELIEQKKKAAAQAAAALNGTGSNTSSGKNKK